MDAWCNLRRRLSLTRKRAIAIRQAGNVDFKGISECYWSDPEVPWDIYSNPKILKQLVGPSGFLVAVASRRIVGFAHYRRFRKTPWFDPQAKKYGQILELHVKKEFQGIGVGSLLMKRAIEKLESEGCPVIYTHTDETNKLALRMYRKFGFKPFLKTFYLKRRLS